MGITTDETTATVAPARTPATQFLALARPSLDRAYRIAGLVLGSSQEAEDAVQDALVIAWQRFGDLRDESRFGAWFDRIVVNGCRDRMRRAKIVRFVPLDGGIDPAGADPFSRLLERDALFIALDELLPDERIVVVLRYWADLPLDEIAARTGWPLGTVKSRLHRATMTLRTAVREEDVR